MTFKTANDYLEEEEENDKREEIIIEVTASLNIENDGKTTYAGPGYQKSSDIPQGIKISEKNLVGYSYSPNYGWIDIVYNGKVIRLAKGHYRLQ